MTRVDSGASFPPIYASKHSRDLPEVAIWSTRGGQDTSGGEAEAKCPEWTDVLIDFRLPQHRGQTLPSPDEPAMALEREVMVWPSAVEGWLLEGWFEKAQAPSNKQGSTDADTVIRFTDPHGFRFAIAVTQEAKNKFGNGRLATLLPTMRFVFLAAGDGSRRARAYGGSGRLDGSGLTPDEVKDDWSGLVLRAEFRDRDGAGHRYYLDALRDAVRDPDAWFGTTSEPGTWRDIDFGPLAGGLCPARALLAWAAAGCTSYAEVAEWVQVRMDPAELPAWQAMDLDPTRAGEWSTDDIRHWFLAMGSSEARREAAAFYRSEDLTPDQAARWVDAVGTRQEGAGDIIRTYEQAGWTPEEVQAVRRAIKHTLGTAAWHENVFSWLSIDPARAVAYLDAGVGVGEARMFENSGDAPNIATLQMMAGLRGPTTLAGRAY